MHHKTLLGLAPRSGGGPGWRQRRPAKRKRAARLRADETAIAIVLVSQPPEHALLRLLDHRPGIDAVFAASDLMATGALHALRRLGRRVPDDVAVIGFDDVLSAQLTDPRLSTIRQPFDAMGVRMVSELMAQITDPGRDPAHVILATELVVRSSA